MWFPIRTSADSAVHIVNSNCNVIFQWILEMVLKLVDGTLLLIRYKTKKTCTVLQSIKQNKGNRVGLVFGKSLVVKELPITKKYVFGFCTEKLCLMTNSHHF